MKTIVAIFGPTACGKTFLAIELAKKLQSQIVSVDSRQVYKLLNIGTAKPQNESSGCEYVIGGINHYMIDLINPDEDIDPVSYSELSNKHIGEIIYKNQIPILVGGSGLYLDFITGKRAIEATKIDSDYRNYLNTLSLQDLQNEVTDFDPIVLDKLNNSDKNNPRRLIRLIEKFKSGVRNINSQNKYNVRYFSPIFKKETLYKRINDRVESMIASGWVEEAEELINMGYRHSPGLQTMGYRQVVEYIDNKCTREEMIENIKQEHRNYSKRQITWMNQYGGLRFVDDVDAIIKELG